MVLASPSVVVVLALVGLLSAVVPDAANSLLTDVGRAVAVALAAPDDKVYPSDLPLPIRVAVAVVSTLIAAVPLVVVAVPVVLVLPLPIAFVVLVGPVVYVATRLFLATPVVILGGHGPVKALTKSWELMGGSVLATLGALLVVFVAGAAASVPVFLLTGSVVATSVVLAVLVATPSVGAQTYLYVEFTSGG